MVTLGSDGEALIKSFESFKRTAYPDSRGVWTIGWGHTADVKEGDYGTLAQAEEWFHQDTQAAVNGLVASLTTTLAQYQEDALISFIFNVGVGAEAHSTLCRLVNARDFVGAAAEFLKWDHIDGVPSAGLLRRRQAERSLFLGQPWQNTPAPV